VDWIYPSLSNADAALIRAAFRRWCDEDLHASTTTNNHPEPRRYHAQGDTLVQSAICRGTIWAVAVPAMVWTKRGGPAWREWQAAGRYQ
jgi:hypothetical protein